MTFTNPLHARPQCSSSCLVVVQIHESHFGSTVLRVVNEFPRKIHAVGNVLGATAPRPLTLLLPFLVVAVALGQVCLRTSPGDGPCEGSRIYCVNEGGFSTSCGGWTEVN